MRLRVYKRKVILLILLVLMCCFTLWRNRKAKEMLSGEESSIQSNEIPAVQAKQRLGNQSQDQSVDKSVSVALVSRKHLLHRNFDQTIRNEDRFKKRDLVVLVQAHGRIEYLKLLIESIQKAKGAESLLLIFSHDYWSPEIDRVVARVDFCQVLQIYFPFSIQLYPQEFPGPDPNDCPRDISKNDALKLGCSNAEYPDSFGHYREAKFSQAKHHWWWKLHFVWERVQVLRNYTGLILFIEEDHYLAPDFVHVLKMMHSLKWGQCPYCNVLSLGSYSHIGYASKANKVEVKAWKFSEHKMGLAMGKETYLGLAQCVDAYCTYDDYNWDWSLQHLTTTCLPTFWKVMVSEAPRIFHTGDCGASQRHPCLPAIQKTKIENILHSSSNQLFPKTLLITKRLSGEGLSPQVKNGGWGDIRDHILCKSYSRLQ